MRYIKALGIVGGALAVAAALAISASATAQSGTAVKIGRSNLGRVLVDSHGKTLYMWAHDKGRRSTCYGDCAEYWPPLITRGRPMARPGAQAGLLGTSRRRDGRLQVTYGGHPLYYFVQDAKPGQTKGEGLTAFGGRWDPVYAYGTAVRKRTSSGGYGAQTAPIQASVIAPRAGDRAGVGGTFSVDVSLQARNAAANSLLS